MSHMAELKHINHNMKSSQPIMDKFSVPDMTYVAQDADLVQKCIQKIKDKSIKKYYIKRDNLSELRHVKRINAHLLKNAVYNKKGISDQGRNFACVLISEQCKITEVERIRTNL